MKKFFGLLLAAVMTFSLVACGAQNVPSDNTSDDYPSGPSLVLFPTPQAAAPMSLRAPS